MVEIIDSISKYNLWGGNSPFLGFNRHIYQEKVMKSVGNSLVKVVVGQRRVGKSFVLRQVLSQIVAGGVPAENTLYINKEFLEFSAIKSAEDLQSLYAAYRSRFSPQGKTYLFIDEIQYIDGWERFVNARSQDFAEPCEVFISGSNSDILSGELSSMLSGRYVRFEVFPYSFGEFCELTGKPQDASSFTDYVQHGALPELFNLDSEEMRRNYVESLKDSVMLRDVVQRYRIKDASLLNDLFVFLSNNASNLISFTNVVKSLKGQGRKTNYETVSTYAGYLENAFLIHSCPRFNIRGKDSLSGPAKYYMNDFSFHNYLYAGFGYGMGYLFENAIYLELRRRGYDVYVGELDGSEVDFVAIRNDARIYIQVAYKMDGESTIAREYAPLEKIRDSYPKFVVSLDEFRLPSNNGILHVRPWEIP